MPKISYPFFFTLFIFTFIGFLSPSHAPAYPSKVEALSRKSLPPLHLPEISIQTLPNGIKLYLLEDHELPIFQAFAFIRGGSVEDPSEKVGLASLMASSLRSGGTQEKKPEEIDRFLENLGAEIETGMSREYGTAFVCSLAPDYPSVLSLFFEILAQPAFRQDKIDLARLQMAESLRRQDDDPEKIAFREFPKLIYGKESLWARTPTAATLDKIQRSDLVQFHHQFYDPQHLILAVVGDFKKEELLSLIEKNTPGRQNEKSRASARPSLQKEWTPGLYLIPKKGPQSTILMGHLGERRFNPDKFALILMNYMLGGDIFSSRLGEEVRSERGLAYNVYSHFGFESDYGLFYGIAQTRTETTGEVIGLMQKEIARFYQGLDMDRASLQFSKDSILNQLINEWEPRFNYVKERARLDLYGYPENYLDIYRKEIKATPLEKVKEVAKQYLFPDKLVILVVGDEKVENELRKLGKVTHLSLKDE